MNFKEFFLYFQKTEEFEWNIEPKIAEESLSKYLIKFNKLEKCKAAEHFDNAANNYEGVYLRAGYPDPWKVAQFVDQFAS